MDSPAFGPQAYKLRAAAGKVMIEAAAWSGARYLIRRTIVTWFGTHFGHIKDGRTIDDASPA